MTSPGTIMVFIFAGLAWLGLSLVATTIFIACRRIFRPTPKPTHWERDWEAIEKELSK